MRQTFFSTNTAPLLFFQQLLVAREEEKKKSGSLEVFKITTKIKKRTDEQTNTLFCQF